MSKLSTAQFRTLEMVASASGRGASFTPPKGPSGRPAKFLAVTELIQFRRSQSCPPDCHDGYWITDKGRAELESVKNGRRDP